MCTNSLESCTSQSQREQMVDRKTSHSRATTLYVPLPVFSDNMVSRGSGLRPKLLGKKLKHSEIESSIGGL